MLLRKWSVRYGVANKVAKFAEKNNLSHERIGPVGNDDAYEIVWFESKDKALLEKAMEKFGSGWA